MLYKPLYEYNKARTFQLPVKLDKSSWYNLQESQGRLWRQLSFHASNDCLIHTECTSENTSPLKLAEDLPHPVGMRKAQWYMIYHDW